MFGNRKQRAGHAASPQRRGGSGRGLTQSKIREMRRSHRQSRHRRQQFILFAAGIALVLVGVAAVTVGPSVASMVTNGGVGVHTGGHIPVDEDDGRAHIGFGDPHAGYSVTPATSGPHYLMANVPNLGVSAPANWGEYEIALPDEVLIHNLEHGGIGLHYDCPSGCPDIVAGLQDVIPEGNPSQFILSPYPGLKETTGSRIAITAWRHHLYLDEVDAAEIDKFIGEYQDRAPESIKGNQFQH